MHTDLKTAQTERENTLNLSAEWLGVVSLADDYVVVVVVVVFVVIVVQCSIVHVLRYRVFFDCVLPYQGR